MYLHDSYILSQVYYTLVVILDGPAKLKSYNVTQSLSGPVHCTVAIY